jgi:hypothetical protein
MGEEDPEEMKTRKINTKVRIELILQVWFRIAEIKNYTANTKIAVTATTE